VRHEVLIIIAMKTSDTMPFNFKKSTTVLNECVTSILLLFWSEDGGRSTLFPNVCVCLFNVTMTSPPHEQGESFNYFTDFYIMIWSFYDYEKDY
jgi:hypothetical protein